MSEDLFPAFIKLRGRQCLVIGAGRVAESKIDSLLRCGAEVRVIAPDATPAIREAALAGKLAWEARKFRPNDLGNVFLVIAATSSPELHQHIFEQAQKAGILCNCVDEPDRCDFYYPAVVRRGPLQIAISTSGRAPLLSQQIRKELEERFGPEYAPWTEEIGRARSEMLTNGTPLEDRMRRLRELCSTRPAPLTRNQTDETKGSGPGKVFFIGAGPGDPELLTRKAWNCLQSADVVLHDALVPDEIVRLTPRTALIINVGKRCGQKSVTQQEINEQMVAQALAGKMVVRLKGGDPLVFGRAGEEIAALNEAGLEFEIVPGVTAASAAAAAAQISLTDRRIASKLFLLSAHGCKGDFAPQWRRFVDQDATLAIYMPGGNYQQIARELQDCGLPGTTPCVIVSQAFRPGQLILRFNLDSLADTPEPPAPAILLIGEVTRAASGTEAIFREEVTEIAVR